MSDAIFDTMTALAACLCEQVRQADVPELCFCGVVPGAVVAHDYVATCAEQDGMGWVRLMTGYPASAVGQVNQTVRNCNAGLGVELELGLLRRAPTMQEGGEPPSEQQQEESTRLQIADMLAMWRAVNCCFKDTDTDYILSDYRPFGPMGFAVGGTYGVMIAL